MKKQEINPNERSITDWIQSGQGFSAAEIFIPDEGIEVKDRINVNEYLVLGG